MPGVSPGRREDAEVLEVGQLTLHILLQIRNESVVLRALQAGLIVIMNDVFLKHNLKCFRWESAVAQPTGTWFRDSAISTMVNNCDLSAMGSTYLWIPHRCSNSQYSVVITCSVILAE
jgi:hypothetical protein